VEAPIEVVCLGEALVDFLPNAVGRQVRDVETWTPCPGGSPANVAIGLARLGARSAMVGTIGQDEFGQFLGRRLAEEGVDVSRLRQTDEGKTGLVFIALSDTGERTFAFHRTRSAELFLAEQDVDGPFLASARALHLGSNSLLFRPAQRAALLAIDAARSAGKIISCDPNLRLHMWSDPGELKQLLDQLLPACSVVKLAEDELSFVTGFADVSRALDSLARQGVALPVATLGGNGAALLWQGTVVRVPAPPARVLDSTGAGDGFVAGLLYGLTRLYDSLAAFRTAGVGEIREIAGFACRMGSRVVEHLGAVEGLPALRDAQGMMPEILREKL
jgi:fructokinase